MGDDRLGWIFDTPSTDALAARYDHWAESYDADHQTWGWQGPTLTAEALRRHAPSARRILDAGCGTGAAGRALRASGYAGELIGVDLSGGMLARAVDAEYDALIRGSILDLSFRAGTFDGIIATGVFTHGHVGGVAFAELVRVATPEAAISITRRDDISEAFAPFSDALASDGVWRQAEALPITNLHENREDSQQTIVTWITLGSSLNK